MSAFIGLLALASLTGYAMRAARRVAEVNRQIDADIAFVQSIPRGVEQ